MKRYLYVIAFITFLFFLPHKTKAQGNQTVANGAATAAVTFPGTGCTYNWTCDNPSIGLAASGMGNIPSFTAVNNTNAPITATITATPVNAGYAYIANSGSNNVSVINITTNLVVATIPVGKFPVGVAVSPDQTKVYVANQSSNNVSVINTATNTVIATVSTGSPSPNGMLVGSSPNGIIVSPDGSKVYVANGVSNDVSIIDATSNALINNILVGGRKPYCVCLSPDGSRLYVTNNMENNVSVINTATNVVITTIPVELEPCGISISPDGSKVYVCNSNSRSISVINTTTNTVTSTMPQNMNPLISTISSDGSKLYFSTNGSGFVQTIDIATNSLISQTVEGSDARGLSLTQDGSELYVADFFDNAVSVIVARGLTVRPSVGKNPISIGNFITGGIGCAPATFTITVNPTPPLPIITYGLVTGNISACAGTASVSPNTQLFQISGRNLTGNVIATAPAGFEVSSSAMSGYGSSVAYTPTLGAVASRPVYVRSAATAAPGNISGNVTLSSPGAITLNIGVTAIVSAIPTVNQVSNQTIANGAATAAINFTGTANTLIWVNDTPGIGLAASGAGNIPSFTAINTGNAPVTATIKVTPAEAGFAYITTAAAIVGNVNQGAKAWVINTLTNMAVDSILVGNAPYGVSVSPDGSRAYVSNGLSNTISVINTATRTVIATIPTVMPISIGNGPSDIAVNPDGSQVYVLNTNTAANGSVWVINALTNVVTAKITVGVVPYAIAVSPDGSMVYVGNNASSTISVIDAATNTVTATINTGNPSGIAVSPDGSRLYVTNAGGYNTVSIINTITNAVISTIPVATVPNNIIISPDGSDLYVAGTNSISVISTATNTIIATIAVGKRPAGLSISPDGSRLFVVNNGSNNVSVIDRASNTVIATIPVGLSPESFGNFISGGTSCSGTPITFTITVNPTPQPPPIIPVIPGAKVIIPNTFTPNNDGINDTWDIKNMESYPNSTVEIFNRYGGRIFYSNNYPVPWNGRYGGNDVPDGTYYYVINLNNGSKPVSGWVAVIR